MIIVDTNVLIDVVENNPLWVDWCAYQLTLHGRTHELAINPVIYAELSVPFESTPVAAPKDRRMGAGISQSASRGTFHRRQGFRRVSPPRWAQKNSSA